MKLFRDFQRHKYILFILLIIVSTTNSCSQPKVDKLNELLEKYFENELFNGSALVANRGEVIYKMGFGFANKEEGIQNQTNTKFRLASVSKQFTAMLILQLAAEGKLNLETPITEYLVNNKNIEWNKITLHHLLTHTSGIPSYTSFPNYRKLMGEFYQPSDLVELFVDSTLNFTPGSRYEYSNSAYSLLGVIIENITGKTYGEVLKEKIFVPLDMNHSGYVRNTDELEKVAHGYYNQVGAVSEASFIDLSVAFSAGGLYSTVEDLYKWDQALYTDKLLDDKYKEQLFGEHIQVREGHYAYGWNVGGLQIGNIPETKWAIYHDGIINGFSSIIVRIPEDTTTIIMLNNTGGAPLYDMTKSIMGILYNQPYKFPQKSLATEMYHTIKEEGIEIGLDHYEKKKGDKSYYLNEGEINLLGYNLMQIEQIDEAAAIFKLNVNTYPNSSNVYDSYGEALLAMGDTSGAFDNYKKSVELNPNNRHGMEILKELGIKEEELIILESGLFETPEGWRKELFHFPLHFAEEIPYKGMEDARFSKGWSDEKSDEFWTYAFAWNIESEKELSASDLEKNLKLYFDGLMKFVDKDRGEVAFSTKVEIRKEDRNNFSALLSIYDAFFSRKPITLNTQISQQYCNQLRKWIIVFKFSPQNLNSNVWKNFKKVRLRKDICQE